MVDREIIERKNSNVLKAPEMERYQSVQILRNNASRTHQSTEDLILDQKMKKLRGQYYSRNAAYIHQP